MKDIDGMLVPVEENQTVDRTFCLHAPFSDLLVVHLTSLFFRNS